jgi:hypothetical protein
LQEPPAVYLQYWVEGFKQRDCGWIGVADSMGSFVMQDFLGSGVLKDLTSKLAEDGWDDVPTLKVIGAEDMEALELTDAQRVSFFFALPFAHIYSSPWT